MFKTDLVYQAYKPWKMNNFSWLTTVGFEAYFETKLNNIKYGRIDLLL